MVLHGGVWFVFGDGLKRSYRSLGPHSVAVPADSPTGAPILPGVRVCASSFDAALTRFAAVAREKGGDAVINATTDVDGAPVSRRNYACQGGRVRLSGLIVKAD